MAKWKNETENDLRVRVNPGDYNHGRPAQWKTVKIGEIVDLSNDPNEKEYARRIGLRPTKLLEKESKAEH